MPLVSIRWYPGASMDASRVSDVADAMPELVARYLHVEEVYQAHLTPKNIEVFVDEGDIVIDVMPSPLDFVVRVEAMYFSERMQKVQEAADRILEDLHERFRNLRFNVWIVLPIAGFAETMWRGAK